MPTNINVSRESSSPFSPPYNRVFLQDGIITLRFYVNRDGYNSSFNNDILLTTCKELFGEQCREMNSSNDFENTKSQAKLRKLRTRNSSIFDIQLYYGLRLFVHDGNELIHLVANSELYTYDDVLSIAPTVLQLIKKTVKYRRIKPEPRQAYISLIVPKVGGLTLTTQELTLLPNVVDNYMPETVEFYNKCKDVLQNNAKGMLLMYGPPGTGKTTLIRQLAFDINRAFIFIPASMISSLADPKLIPLLLENRNSVLVIEDAETALRERDKAFSEATASTLLQLSDGILSDVLGVTVIATFNTSLDNVDPAFLRAGRCLAKHEFPLLSGEKLAAIAAKRNIAVSATSILSIAQLMNQ